MMQEGRSGRTLYRGRRNVQLPLLVLTNEDDPKTIRPVTFPMPASHLPVTEVSTLNMYGTEITSPAHIRLVQEAMTNSERMYGQVVWKNPSVSSAR